MGFRSGLVSIVGRPNSGKSTLLNAIVGEKLAITSSKPQTTRHVVRGVVNRPGRQLVLVDTPGLHRPRTLLGQRLNDEVRSTLSDVDVIAVTLPADEKVGPGDRYIATEAAGVRRAPKVAVVTKADLVRPEQMAVHLTSVQRLGAELGFEWAEIIPVSARTGFQVDLLVDLLVELLPDGPMLFPADQVTDEPILLRVGELVREAALEGVRDELPHSIAVVVDEIEPRTDRPVDRPLTDVRVTLFVERDSQKAIVIGQGGSRLRAVGAAARQGIEPLVGTPVFLDLRVKVAKDWQRDPKQLRRLGF
ncbi:MAG: GTPase Era [Actinomycetota bacterium]|nr:GTPase Era [Actinomycetota bacterium]MDH5278830.1 GTPase Era [Actinomycetota bacterium]